MQEQSQDSGAIKQIGNVLLTVPEDFVFHSSDEGNIYDQWTAAALSASCPQNPLRTLADIRTGIHLPGKCTMDAARNEAELGTPQTKTTRQLSNGLWYSYHYMDASSWASPDFEGLCQNQWRQTADGYVRRFYIVPGYGGNNEQLDLL